MHSQSPASCLPILLPCFRLPLRCWASWCPFCILLGHLCQIARSRRLHPGSPFVRHPIPSSTRRVACRAIAIRQIRMIELEPTGRARSSSAAIEKLSEGRSEWLQSNPRGQSQKCSIRHDNNASFERTINDRDLDVIFVQLECICDLSVSDLLGGRFRGQSRQS